MIQINSGFLVSTGKPRTQDHAPRIKISGINSNRTEKANKHIRHSSIKT